jgi:hypothetical protein
MRMASFCNVVAGVWIALAPWGLDYPNDEAILNSVLVGVVIAVIASVRVAGAYRAAWLSWINVGAGAWLAASGFVLDASGIALWNSLVFGITVSGLAWWSALASDGRQYYRAPATPSR